MRPNSLYLRLKIQKNYNQLRKKLWQIVVKLQENSSLRGHEWKQHHLKESKIFRGALALLAPHPS